MIEIALLHIIKLLFTALVAETIITFSLIIDLAKMVNENGLKDEKTLRTVINKLSLMTGKDVSKDLEDKIIDTIKEDKVPKNVKDMF